MAGIGLRWGWPGSFLVRGLAARMWTDVGGGVGAPGIDRYWVDPGLKR